MRALKIHYVTALADAWTACQLPTRHYYWTPMATTKVASERSEVSCKVCLRRIMRSK